MRATISISIAFLAAFGQLSLVSSRALKPLAAVPNCSEEKCLLVTHRALSGPFRSRADIFFGEDPASTPHESPSSGDPTSGDPSGGSSNNDPSSRPGQLDLGPSTAGDRTASLPYGTYQNRGVTARDSLNQAIEVNRADITYSDMTVAYEPFDADQEHSFLTTFLDLPGVFSDPDVGLNIQGKYADRSWESKTPAPQPQKDGTNIINWSLYNPSEGSIIVRSVDSSRDGLPAGDSRKLPSSEIAWQIWKGIAGNAKGNLRVVIQNDVDNIGTLNTIATAYAKNNLDVTSARGDFALDGQNAARNDAFTALLGTDSVRPTEYMLTDHHQEMGDKKVQRILTYPPNYEGKTTAMWNIVILMGKDA